MKKNNESAVVNAFVKALPKPLKNAVKKRSVHVKDGNIVVSRTMTLDPCNETNWNLAEQFVDGRYEPELDQYVYEINDSFYETPEYAQFLRRNRLHTSWPVQEGADMGKLKTVDVEHAEDKRTLTFKVTQQEMDLFIYRLQSTLENFERMNFSGQYKIAKKHVKYSREVPV